MQQLLEKNWAHQTQTQEAQFLQTSLCLFPPPLWGTGRGGGQNTILWFDRNQNIKGPTTNLLSEFQILKNYKVH
jgi:hypothetical protein